MVRRELAARPGSLPIPSQIWRRRRFASVDDEHLHLGRNKIPCSVRKMHKEERKANGCKEDARG